MKRPSVRVQAAALIVALVVLLVCAILSPLAYALVVSAARSVILVYCAQRATLFLHGGTVGLLEFVAGCGAILYVLGVLADLAGFPNINGRDLDFLVRGVGIAFLVLPLALAGLPQHARRALRIEAC